MRVISLIEGNKQLRIMSQAEERSVKSVLEEMFFGVDHYLGSVDDLVKLHNRLTMTSNALPAYKFVEAVRVLISADQETQHEFHALMSDINNVPDALEIPNDLLDQLSKFLTNDQSDSVLSNPMDLTAAEDQSTELSHATVHETSTDVLSAPDVTAQTVASISTQASTHLTTTHQSGWGVFPDSFLVNNNKLRATIADWLKGTVANAPSYKDMVKGLVAELKKSDDLFTDIKTQLEIQKDDLSSLYEKLTSFISEKQAEHMEESTQLITLHTDLKRLSEGVTEFSTVFQGKMSDLYNEMVQLRKEFQAIREQQAHEDALLKSLETRIIKLETRPPDAAQQLFEAVHVTSDIKVASSGQVTQNSQRAGSAVSESGGTRTTFAADLPPQQGTSKAPVSAVSQVDLAVANLKTAAKALEGSAQQHQQEVKAQATEAKPATLTPDELDRLLANIPF